MSMVITVTCTEGIVMGSDSACSMLTMIDLQSLLSGNIAEAYKKAVGHNLYGSVANSVGSHITSSTFQKLHVMKGNNIAFSEGNEWVTRNTKMSIKPYLDYFCLNNHFDNPKTAACELLNYVRKIDPTMDAVFHVGGYNFEGEIPTPEFWYVSVLKNEAREVASKGSGGLCFSGANDYISPYIDQINKNMIYYSLQDAVDLVMFAFEMSMNAERFIKLERHITPPIDLLAITQSGVEWVQRKKLEA